MRVTGNSTSAAMLARLNLLASRQSRLQQQVITGQRVTAPEDDPAALGAALGLQADSGRLGQQVKNIATLQNHANAAYNAIQTLNDVMDRASEVTMQADAFKSPNELQIFAREVDQLLEQAAQIANRQHGSQYLFCGTGGGGEPFQFTRDADGRITSVEYRGNTATASVEVSDGLTVSATAVGQNTTGAGARGLFADSRAEADVFGHLISLRDHLQTGNTQAVATTDHAALLADGRNIIFQSAHYGLLTTQVNAAESTDRAQDVGLLDSLVDVAGADTSGTIVQLTQAQNAYQLALQSSAKVLQLQQSLLNYLP